MLSQTSQGLSQSRATNAKAEGQSKSDKEGGQTQSTSNSSPDATSSLPSISLPKGGGAIRDIGEKFDVNSATGTGTMTIPVALSKGRGLVQPTLTLAYNSGSGNGPYGLGWSVSVPSITRKTDRGIPRYNDTGPDDVSDVFMMSGEDLVPVFKRDAQGNISLKAGNQPEIAEDTRNGFIIRRYIPRIEEAFTRVERWTRADDPRQIHWRTTTKNNVTSIYGRDDNSKIFSTLNSIRQTYTWLLAEMYDTQGNAVIYTYKPEDSVNVPLGLPHEQNRSPETRSTNRYLKNIQYGNKIPNRDDVLWSAHSAFDLPKGTWMFSVVFDYGEHDINTPTTSEVAPWPCRSDPFSNFRAGFEVRTYRLCQRMLMFHHFPIELGVEDCLINSTNLGYDHTPVASYLTHVTHAGYIRAGVTYLSKSLPPLEFSYSRFPTEDQLSHLQVQTLDSESLKNMPSGVDGSSYQWLDLDGEGLPGVFVEQGRAWFYKSNTSEAESNTSSAKFGPIKTINPMPNHPGKGQYKFVDLVGDGHLHITEMGPNAMGFYKRTADGGWTPYRPFKSIPNLDFTNPEMKFVDVTGNGLADILVSEDRAFVWHSSLGEDGYAPGVYALKPDDEGKGAKIIFGDPEQTIYLADMSGDGLADLVRVRNNDICYWPNLGYGRFGAKVQMSNAPRFDRQAHFNQTFIRLADIDGSGTSDLLYITTDRVDIYLNQAGNGFGKRQALSGLCMDNLSAVATMDLLGTGTTYVVWSSTLSANQRSPMKYIDLTNGIKPNLLIRAVNNLGSETKIQYATSTKFYQLDKQAGHPWITKLAFPVHCVERVETIDHISKNVFVSRYAYHHGYFDGFEREFRGFAMVSQWDTEDYAAMTETSASFQATNISSSWHIPPRHTKTWFHTGVFLEKDKITRLLAHEYFGAPAMSDDGPFQEFLKTLLDDTSLPAGLTAIEIREACRSLKGRVLREEIYADDRSERSGIPYTVTESNYTVHGVQSLQDKHFHGSYRVHPRERITFDFERKLDDPRILHEMTLQVDDYGNTLKSLEVAYGRTKEKSLLVGMDRSIQELSLLRYYEQDVTNTILDPDDYLLPKLSEFRSYQLYGINVKDMNSRYKFEDFTAGNFGLLLTLPQIPFESAGDGSLLQKRLVDSSRILYRTNDLSALLPGGKIESLGIVGEKYRLAFTPTLLPFVFKRFQDDGSLQNLSQVLTGKGGNAGGYVYLNSDRSYWAPSGRLYFHPDTMASAAGELATAKSNFFQPRRHTDPFGQTDLIDYDNYDLLATRTTDAVGNVQEFRSNYRVLSPDRLVDANGNRAECVFDELGRVAGTAVGGKISETLGDNFDDFSPSISSSELGNLFADPTGPVARSLLGNATTRVIYNTSCFWLDSSKSRPTFEATLSRETHVSDSQGSPPKIQISFSYYDGFGREIQKKSQTEPSAISDDGQVQAHRWIGSGWKVFNNKGNPVQQFEPFFDNTHEFNFNRRVGVASILLYDALDRNVVTLHPDHSWSKSVYNPWEQGIHDTNDTSSQSDPKADVDVGCYFQLLPDSEYLPTWFDVRNTGQLGKEEQSAALKAFAHSNTPEIHHMDSLGRTFLTTANNGHRGLYNTRHVLDITGRLLRVIDPRGHTVEQYTSDMTGNIIHKKNIDAGERWELFDVGGNGIYKWDSRKQRFRTTFDELRRPTATYCQGEQQPEIILEKIIYGESQPAAQDHNWKNKVFQSIDQAGVNTNLEFDFKGNLISTQRQFTRDYKSLIHWGVAVPLEDPIYVSQMHYDALNRMVEQTTADNTVRRYSFNHLNLLQSVKANIGGETSNGQPTWTTFVSNIDYNAKNQRTLVQYGNNVSTVYKYDPLTFRLRQLITTRDGGRLQDLQYYYDPIGNISSIKDAAQQVVYFRNRRVEPSHDYTYDATYRLIEATGREHLGLINTQSIGPTPPTAIDHFHTSLDHPSDGNALGTYTEFYNYDSVGNFLSVQHRGDDPVHPGWTRNYVYNEMSTIEPGVNSNRLSATTAASSTEFYGYDGHGNMTLPHLSVMQWDCKDQLRATAIQNTNNSRSPETTWYSYDAKGHRIRKVTERFSANGGSLPTQSRQRLYIGDFELYQEFDITGSNVTLERRTTHIAYSEVPIALVERITIGDLDPPITLTRYQHRTHNSSVCLELDDLGRIISYEEYSPFGSTVYQGVRNAMEAPKQYRYANKERDKESGLDYYGARYYAPWISRWIGSDPQGLIDGVNGYEFVRSNPILYKDRGGNYVEAAAVVGEAALEAAPALTAGATEVAVGAAVTGAAAAAVTVGVFILVAAVIVGAVTLLAPPAVPVTTPAPAPAPAIPVPSPPPPLTQPAPEIKPIESPVPNIDSVPEPKISPEANKKTEPEPRVGPVTAEPEGTEKKPKIYRIRIQAQGPDPRGKKLEKSVHFEDIKPIKAKKALQLLAELRNKLTKDEYLDRRKGFGQAARFILEAQKNDGISYQGSISFPRGRKIRVDLELTGPRNLVR